MKNILIWFILWLSFLSWISYAANTWSIWALFTKIWWNWFLMWDKIQDWTIDSSEIEDNSLTSSDLGSNSVWTSEVSDNTISTTDILNNTITENDISDSFIARNSDKLDNLDSTNFMRLENSIYDWMIDNSWNPSNWIRTPSPWIIPYTSWWSSLWTLSWPFSNIFWNDIYDNWTLLENKYLWINSKAVDSNLLDWLDSTYFASKTYVDSKVSWWNYTQWWFYWYCSISSTIIMGTTFYSKVVYPPMYIERNNCLCPNWLVKISFSWWVFLCIKN